MTSKETGESRPRSEAGRGHHVGRRIRELRRERGWSQRRLGKEAGVVQQNLSLYERGLADPRLETLARLADALDADVRIVPRTTTADEPLTIARLLEYVDRQIERTLERDRAGRGTG
jgi:transcriptional regulator with XRE-family HTH domain